MPWLAEKLVGAPCGCSSVVEHLVANEKVKGPNPFTRSSFTRMRVGCRSESDLLALAQWAERPRERGKVPEMPVNKRSELIYAPGVRPANNSAEP